MPIRIYLCKCGFYFLRLSDDLWYGPIWEIPTAHLMNTEEYNWEYPGCYGPNGIVMEVTVNERI